MTLSNLPRKAGLSRCPRPIGPASHVTAVTLVLPNLHNFMNGEKSLPGNASYLQIKLRPLDEENGVRTAFNSVNKM